MYLWNGPKDFNVDNVFMKWS